MVTTIIFIVLAILIILFLVFERQILAFIYRKVKDSNTVVELEDKSILTPYKIYTYKIGSVSSKEKQDVIKSLSVKTPLEIKKVINKDKKLSLAFCYKNKEIGYLASSFMKQNLKDLFSSKYNIVISKIDVVRNKKYPYVKIWKESTSAFDLTNILKKIDYRIGDKVKHSTYGEGIVKEIKMNSVLVAFPSLKEITDLKSLVLIK